MLGTLVGPLSFLLNICRIFSLIIAKMKNISHFAWNGKVFPTIPSTWQFFFYKYSRQNCQMRWRFALTSKPPHEVAVWLGQTAISFSGFVLVNRHLMWRFALCSSNVLLVSFNSHIVSATCIKLVQYHLFHNNQLRTSLIWKH